MTEKLFLYEPLGNNDAHTLLPDAGAVENADQLVKEGKAEYVELGKYDAFRDKAQTLHNEFHASRERILKDDHPTMQDKRVRDYELQKVAEEYESKVKQLQADYDEYKTEALQQAQTNAAQSYKKATTSDMETAKQFVDSANIELMTAFSDRDKSAVIEGIAQDIARLTEGQRAALQSEIVKLLPNIESRAQRNKVAYALQSRDKDKLSVKVAEQLPHSVTLEYDQYRAITRKGRN